MPSESQRTLTLRTRLPLYLIGLLAILQIVTPHRTWVYLLVGMLVWLGLSYAWARALQRGLVAQRKSRGIWVVAGDRLEEQFSLFNHSAWPAAWVEVRDQSNVPHYAIDRVAAVEGHGHFSWDSEGICQQRGVFTLGPWSLITGDAFGLFEATLTYPEARTLLVYPRVMLLPDFPLPQGRTSGEVGRTQPANEPTLLTSSVRPYAPGDSYHLIHWRKTAQHGDIMVKQFDMEPMGGLWLVIDLDESVQAGAGQESTLEYGITLAASLAARHLAENRAVGLVAYGKKAVMLPPQPGSAYLWRILDALAHAEAGPGWPLARVLGQIGPDIGRGFTLLAVTPSTASNWVAELLQMRRRDIAPAALLIDAASFTGAVSAELPQLCNLLADQSIPAHVIDRRYVFRPTARIKRKRTVLKTLGTGRVVPVEVEEEV